MSFGVGRTGRQLIYDSSFVNVDKLDTVQTSWRVAWEFIFLECQQCYGIKMVILSILWRWAWM